MFAGSDRASRRASHRHDGPVDEQISQAMRREVGLERGWHQPFIVFDQHATDPARRACDVQGWRVHPVSELRG